jgi:DNA repair protein RecO (recombination protein O)
MLSRTRAIVVKTTKYSDNSLIVKLYTELHGLKTYIVGGVHGKKSKAALFMPLSLLEIVANHKEKNKLIRPKEIGVSEPLQQVHSDIQKSSLLLFLNEVIYKSVKEEEQNPELFSFLFTSILELEHSSDSIANFHIAFLLKFTQHLGFYPHGKFNDSSRFFNLQEGVFSSEKTNDTLDEKTSKVLYECLNESYVSLINRDTRKGILDRILQFYAYHIHGFGTIKSLEVLHEINL